MVQRHGTGGVGQCYHGRLFSMIVPEQETSFGSGGGHIINHGVALGFDKGWGDRAFKKPWRFRVIGL